MLLRVDVRRVYLVTTQERGASECYQAFTDSLTLLCESPSLLYIFQIFSVYNFVILSINSFSSDEHNENKLSHIVYLYVIVAWVLLFFDVLRPTWVVLF